MSAAALSTAPVRDYTTARETEKQIAALQRQLQDLRLNKVSAIKVIDRDPGMQELVERLDGEIAEVQARLRELRGVTPGEVLAEVEANIAMVEGELRQLNPRKIAAIEAKLKKEPGAVPRLRQVQKEIAAVTERLEGLRQRRGELRQQIAAAQDATARHQAATTPRRAAELARERAGLAETATAAAHTLAAALRGLARNGDELGDLLDDQGARNFLGDAAFRGRVQSALARAFAINPSSPLTAANSLLGISSQAVGPQAHFTLAEHEEPALDDLVPVRLSQAEAEASRDRLEVRGDLRIVVPIAGVFALVRHEHVFGDELAASRAARRAPVPMAVVAFDGGYVLIPAAFSGEAA